MRACIISFVKELAYRFGLSITLTTVILSLVALSSKATAQIKSPGAHPNYSVELEPHGLVQWDVEPFDDEGLGIGIRASIPLLDNGPVKTINNSLAIGFGLDWAYSGDDCRVGRYDFVDCDTHNITLPLTVQWNFFFTDVISAFVELGIGIMYQTWDYEPAYPDVDDDDIDPELFFLIGPRFLVGDSIAIPIRIGWPYLSIGVSFLI